MKERPIIYGPEMIRAKLDDRKTQTRRPINPQPPKTLLNPTLLARDPAAPSGYSFISDEYGSILLTCPYGQPGDRLWIKETLVALPHDDNGFLWTHYKADGKQVLTDVPGINDGVIWEWKRPYLSSRFMPKWACRMKDEILDVKKPEKLLSISLVDVRAEGFLGFSHFFKYWDSLYIKKPEYQVKANPWAWVIGFRTIQKEGGLGNLANRRL